MRCGPFHQFVPPVHHPSAPPEAGCNRMVLCGFDYAVSPAIGGHSIGPGSPRRLSRCAAHGIGASGHADRGQVVVVRIRMWATDFPRARRCSGVERGAHQCAGDPRRCLSGHRSYRRAHAKNINRRRWAFRKLLDKPLDQVSALQIERSIAGSSPSARLPRSRSPASMIV